VTVPVFGPGSVAFSGDAFVAIPQPLGSSATTAGWTFLTLYSSSDTTHKAALAAINLTASTHQIQIVVNHPSHPHVVSVYLTPAGTSWASPTVVDDGAVHTIVVQVPGPGAGNLRIFVDGHLTASFAVAAAVIDAVQPSAGTGSQIGGLLPDTTGGATMTLQEVALFRDIQAVQDIAHDGALPQETTGDRFNRVLDMIAHPASQRDVASGTLICARDVSDNSQTKALAYLQRIEATEQGQCHMLATGRIVFRDRNWRAAHVTSSATFSDRDRGAYPADLPYDMGGVTLNFDRAELFNEIPVAARGGTPQLAVDAASQLAYTQRTMPGLSDLLMATDADALACAEFILASTKQPQFRVGDLVINPTVDDRLWPVVLGLDIGDVITVIKSRIPGGGSPISLVCRIEGIEHEVTPPTSWLTTWHVSLV